MDVTLVLQWVLVVVLALAGAWVAVKVAEGVKALKLSPDMRWFLDSLVETAVNAAEQMFLDEDEAGLDKLEYALKWLEVACKKYGISWDETLINGLVEAKVKELFGAAKDVFNPEEVK